MASFTEQATLKVNDQSSAAIRKINAELKKLEQTAKSLKSIQINFGGGFGKASGDIRKLTTELRQLQSVARNIPIRINTASAQQQLAQLRASAQRPITVATRAATTPRTAAPGLGVLGRVGPFGVHVLGGTVGLTLASLHALAGAIGRAAKEGVKQVDIGDTALGALQLKPGERSAAEAAIEAIRKAQPGTPGGALLNRGLISNMIAETMPLAGYDPKQAEWLANQQIELIKMEVQRGRTLDQATENSVRYIKALDLAGLLKDAKGVFDPAKAASYINALKQIAPSIGKEFTGENVFQFMKYARQARYTATPETLMYGMLTSEEMGASSAGVALNQAVRQLLGLNVPGNVLTQLEKHGLVTTKLLEEGTTGKQKRRKKIVDQPLDEEMLRANFWQFVREKLIPKMKAEGLDPSKPLDAAKFAAPITSTATARDLVTGAITRMADLMNEVERAKLRDPRLSVDPKSMLIAAEGLASQIRGVLGEAVNVFEPILIPGMQKVGGYMADLAGDMRAATQGDRKAQERVEGTTSKMLAAAGGLALAKGPLGQVIGAVAAPAGITAGLLGAMAPGASQTAQSLSYAGISLNAAGQSLQAAADSQLSGWGQILNKLGIPAAVVGGVLAAEGAGLIKGGGDLQPPLNPEFVRKEQLKVRQKELTATQQALEQHSRSLQALEQEAVSETERKGMVLADIARKQGEIAAVTKARDDLNAEIARLSVVGALPKGYENAAAEAARIAGSGWTRAMWDAFWKQVQQPPPVPAAATQPIQQAIKRLQDAGKTLRDLPRLVADEAKEGGGAVKGGRTRGRVPLPKPAPRPKDFGDPAKEGKDAYGGKVEPPPGVAKTAEAVTDAASKLATVSDSMTAFTAALTAMQGETPAWLATLDATPARFTTVFGTAATAIGGAGTVAADALAGRAPGIGSIIGNVAGDALAAKAAAIAITINAKGGERPDAGDQRGPT